MKKILVTYYSRTGTTRKVGNELAKRLRADVEEIVDTKDRSGVMGYIRSGRDAMKKSMTDLKPLKSDLSEYDLVVIGTPIWGWTVSVPVRTFLAYNQDWLKKVAFFCTMGGSGDDKAFREMAKVCGREPVATLSLLTKEVQAGGYKEKLDAFVSALKK